MESDGPGAVSEGRLGVLGVVMTPELPLAVPEEMAESESESSTDDIDTVYDVWEVCC